MTAVNIKGLAELQHLLDVLPAKIEANIMSGALRAGANVLKEEAAALCPIGAPSEEGRRLYGQYTGALRDSIRISAFRKNGKIVAVVKVGGKTKKGADVWYAHIIEFTGAVPHKIFSQKGKKLPFGDASFDGRTYRRSVKHPGMKARPFMRPALYNKGEAAIKAAGEYIKRRLMRKNGIDTSDIAIGGEA